MKIYMRFCAYHAHNFFNLFNISQAERLTSLCVQYAPSVTLVESEAIKSAIKEVPCRPSLPHLYLIRCFLARGLVDTL
jgi:hypothetical protein